MNMGEGEYRPRVELIAQRTQFGVLLTAQLDARLMFSTDVRRDEVADELPRLMARIGAQMAEAMATGGMA